jgi:uncharacterized protein (TIGR03083 family)
VDHASRIDRIEGELAALVAAVEAGPLDARVPTCPDFSVDELAHHVGTFCGFWTHVLCEGTSRPKTRFVDLQVEGPGATEPADRAAWLAAAGSALVAELRATDPETPVWTWYPPDQSAGFVARRCSHELAVHRVDVELARGQAGPIDPELAADGIEEIFVLLEFGREHVPSEHLGTGQTLHLHGTDHVPAEWLITLGPDGVDVDRVHAKGDLALRGSVSDLEMLLYQRPPVGAVEQFGEVEVLDLFHREFTFG